MSDELRAMQATKAQKRFDTAIREMEGAKSDMQSLPAPHRDVPLRYIDTAIKAAKRATGRIGLSIAMLMGGSLAMNAQEASATPADGDRLAPSAQVIESGGWNIGKNEDRMEGLTGIDVRGPLVSSGESLAASIRITCEAGDLTPDVDLVLAGSHDLGGLDHADVRMRFDNGGAIWQGTQAVRASTDATVLRVSNDMQSQGFGSSKFAKQLANSDKLLIRIPQSGENHLIEFDTSDVELSASVDQMGELCGMQSKQELAMNVSLAPAPNAPPRAHLATRGGEMRDARHNGASLECNRGLFSREGARWAGRGVGALAGYHAAKELGKEGRGRLVGALLGAIVGDRVSSTMDRKLQNRREANSPSVGDVRVYQVNDGTQVGFASLANGDVCVTRTDSNGEEMSTKRVSGEKGRGWEDTFIRGNARVVHGNVAQRTVGLGR